MASVAGKFIVNCIGLILVLSINHASSNQYSGILSKLYDKAAQEKRPLILVLDNSLNAKPLAAKPLELIPRHPRFSAKKQTPSMSSYNGQKFPIALLEHLAKQKKETKLQAGQSLISNIFGEKKLRKGKKKLPYQIDRFDWDKIQDQSVEYQSVKILIKKNKQGFKSQSGIDKRVLRSSILANVLRQSNDNCEVVEDNCDTKKDSCEVKVECEETKPKDSDECTFSDTCAEDNKEISTKGVLLEDSCEGNKNNCRK